MTESGTKLFKMYTQIVSTSFLSVQFLIHIPLQRYKFSSQNVLSFPNLKTRLYSLYHSFQRIPCHKKRIKTQKLTHTVFPIQRSIQIAGVRAMLADKLSAGLDEQLLNAVLDRFNLTLQLRPILLGNRARNHWSGHTTRSTQCCNQRKVIL